MTIKMVIIEVRTILLPQTLLDHLRVHTSTSLTPSSPILDEGPSSL